MDQSAMASASLPSMNVEEELKCPICLEYMTDPVSVDCGHCFCRGCITNYCERRIDLINLDCLLCGVKIHKENFRPNWPLANILKNVKGLSSQTERGAMCGRHNEALNLFCKEDEELVCVRCERSQEHRSHTVLLLEDAADEYKDQFSRFLETLKEMKENIPSYLEGIEIINQDLLAKIKASREKTVAEFRHLDHFLKETEHDFLVHLEEMEKEAEMRRIDFRAGVSKELFYANNLILELEEKQHQSASELLKDIGRTLERCNDWKELQAHVAFPPVPKGRNYDIYDIHPFVEGVIKQFKETLESGLLSLRGCELEDDSRTQSWHENLDRQIDELLKGRGKRRCLEAPEGQNSCPPHWAW